jgi:hypothetical protein
MTTIYRLSEEIMKMLNGGKIPVASNTTINEIKIAVCQVANSLLKVEYFTVNAKWGEMIPNGSSLGYYTGIGVERWKNKSRARLPIKPIKLPRDMGVYSVFKSDEPDNEFIPLEMGQWSLLRSQPLINNLLGQVGRTTYGDYVEFTQDITIPGENVTVDMRLVILDFSLYGDFDPLPVLPEQEWQIKQEVVKLYGGEPSADKVSDPSVSEQKNVPIIQQRQA